jgi:hypothetical protein
VKSYLFSNISIKIGGNEIMKQVKYFMIESKANKWLKDHSDKEIIDIKMSAGGFGIIYEESSL